MTKANSEYFELEVTAFNSGESYFNLLEQNFEVRSSMSKKLFFVIDGQTPVQNVGITRVMQDGNCSLTNTSHPIHKMGTRCFFLHDSFYTFLKFLDMDDLWDTYPVELYEKDGKTRIPNYHYGLIVRQHVGFVLPPWATPRTPSDPLYGSPGISPLKGTWFNEAELKDDRLFCINQGPPMFRKDIKEKIATAFPSGIEWKNLKDM